VMSKLVAKYADTWNAFGTPDEMRERNQLLDEYCHELGRDPETLDRSLYYWVPKSDADPWASEQAFHDVIGPYVEAHYRVHRDLEAALSLLRPFEHHLSDAGLGSISEIMDGDPPHLPRGCIAQAWGVAELLRVWLTLSRHSG